ncbi:MAG: DUF4159 domain-containing protein [Planctomycetota bacterium]|nr:DUF4159 domain-containing protein [Planctomycetota bacterium]
MRRRLSGRSVFFGLITAAVLLAAAHPVPAQDSITAETITDAHVRKAIDAMVEALYDLKKPERFWDPQTWGDEHGSKYQVGGYTALAVLALLSSGESYQNPRLRDAVAYLEHYPMEGTYAVSLRAAIWARLPEKFLPNLAADTKWLLDGFSVEVGGWAYEQRPNTERKDNSIRQYGALGLWEAAKRGARIDPRYWRRLEEALIAAQLPDGGWNYRCDERPATGSMTAAGLATLFITQDLLHGPDAVPLRQASGNRPNRLAIDRGLAWMDRHFSATENPGRFRDYYYYMYGVERVGLASGLKHFGEHDWFREGAAEIIRRLCQWDEATRTMTVRARGGGTTQTRHLSFALMFLSRGRVPVAINKLADEGMAWNNRPRDAANIARRLSDTTEADLNWQIVNMDGEPEAWLDAPLLYLASDDQLPWLADVKIDAEALKRDVREFLGRRAEGEIPMDSRPPEIPSTPELRKLKRYLDLGGLLLAVSEGPSRTMNDSIDDLGTLLYPQYDWQRARPDHWAYTLHGGIRGRRPPLRVLSNGVRDLIIHCPGPDLAASFQQGEAGEEAHFDLATNIYFYASEMNRPRPRLQRHALDAGRLPPTRRTVRIVRGVHGGNWKPEPRALDVFNAQLAREQSMRLRILDRPLHETDELDPPPDLVIVSGIEGHEFTTAQREAIRAFARAGGLILFETPGGRGDFTLSAEQMAARLFEAPVRPLLRDPVITGRGVQGASDLTRLNYRPYAREVFGARETTPRLTGMELDGGLRLLFSREDITHALLDQPGWGVSGYDGESARKLMTNIVLHAITAGRK